MKIKSNFRDYYDYISEQYGGGDPKTVYIRHTVEDAPVNEEILHRLRKNVSSWPDFEYEGKVIETKFLACAGKLYFIHRSVDDIGNFYKDPLNSGKTPKQGSWKVFSDQDVERYIEYMKGGPRYINRTSRLEEYKSLHGKEISEVVEISKVLDAPVFIFANELFAMGPRIILNKHVPSLASMGMQDFVEPQTMYRDIEFFINNVLRSSPDLAPPVKVADKDRIVQHGFDLRQSFRHRK